MIISIFSSTSTLWMDHYLNIGLLESLSIVCQFYIENRESECLVWRALIMISLACRSKKTAIWFGFQLSYSAHKLGSSCLSFTKIQQQNEVASVCWLSESKSEFIQSLSPERWLWDLSVPRQAKSRMVAQVLSLNTSDWIFLIKKLNISLISKQVHIIQVVPVLIGTRTGLRGTWRRWKRTNLCQSQNFLFSKLFLSP